MHTDREFLESLFRAIRNHLHEKNDKQHLPEIIHSHMNLYSMYRQSLEKSDRHTQKKTITVDEYTPQSSTEAEFLKNLLK
jgi:hypothetical protein